MYFLCELPLCENWWPVVGFSAPTNNFANVDLPDPVSPTIAKVFLASKEKDVGSSAVKVFFFNQYPGNRYVLLRLLTSKREDILFTSS